MKDAINKSFFFIALIGAIIFSTQANAQIQVSAQVESDKSIYIGESFGYHIIIDGENKPGEIDLSPLAEYNPQNTGNRDISQTSISIINGRSTTKTIKRFVMSYSLTANSTGIHNIPPITVTIDGTSYQTNPTVIRILQPEQTDQLELEISLSQQECYVGQPVELAVRFYLYADIGQFGMDVPALHSDLFYTEDPDTANPDAKQYRLSGSIPEPVFITQTRVTHKGRAAILLFFRKILIPKSTGKMQIEAATVSADVVVRTTRDFWGDHPEYKRFAVRSEPLTLDVKPLPEQNKPEGFYGLIGDYTISAAAEPTKVNVGDPITLTIKIGGPYLKPVRWPDLEQVKELAENFKIPSQKASPTIEDKFKIFTQTIRANNDEITAIPSIPLAYFNAEKGEYEIAQSKPIKLDVAPTKILTTADLEGEDFVKLNKEVEAIKKGLSANYEGSDVLVNMSFSPMIALVRPAYVFIWLAPLAVLILSLAFKLLTHTTIEKETLKRRRRACAKAVKHLRKILSSDQKHQNETIISAMKQFIGDRFDKSAGSLTADDCCRIIADATGDFQSAEKFKQIITQCEETRYAPVNETNDKVKVQEVIKIIKNIDRNAKNAKTK